MLSRPSSPYHPQHAACANSRHGVLLAPSATDIYAVKMHMHNALTFAPDLVFLPSTATFVGASHPRRRPQHGVGPSGEYLASNTSRLPSSTFFNMLRHCTR